MRERIRRVLDDNMTGRRGTLEFSCEKVDIVLKRERIYEGSFTVRAVRGSLLGGYVKSSDVRMEVLTSELEACSEEICYRFHGEDLEVDESAEGCFSIVSNCGEYTLPFSVRREQIGLVCEEKEIKDLSHFAEFAKSNWPEAVKLFYSQDFPCIIGNGQVQLYDCYRALSECVGKEQNLDEFLIYAGYKQAAGFITEDREIFLELSYEEGTDAVVEVPLRILRDGWGYTALQVACEGDFVFTEKSFLSDDDFLGNYCRLPVYIDSSRCRRGNCFGKIRFYNFHVSLEVPVTVKAGAADAALQAERSRKHALVNLMSSYVRFRLKKLTAAVWLTETMEAIEGLLAMDENGVAARLFQAQLMLTQNRENEARWILDRAAELMEQEELTESSLWAYYLYLTTLLCRDEAYVKDVTEEIELLYRKNKQEWWIAWLLLYLPSEYSKSVVMRWNFLEKQFTGGCRSPILYIEALQLINNNPAVLRRLDEFGKQVLYFGVKWDNLSAEAIEQFLYLVERIREHSAVLTKIMMLLYERHPDERILRELCILLIKGGKSGNEYARWYEKGVEAEFRITNLYEYYLMSLDPEKTDFLPKSLLLYFRYQNIPDKERAAFLYRYVLTHREEDCEMYDAFLPKIERFMTTQLEKGRITPELAEIYRQLLPHGQAYCAGNFPVKLLFAYQVKGVDKRFCRAIVYQPGNLIPAFYQLQDGKGLLFLYGSGNVVAFEDSSGNRFLLKKENEPEQLMDPGRYPDLFAAGKKDESGLQVYQALADTDEVISADMAACYEGVAAGKYAEPFLKRKAYMHLLEYYAAEEDKKHLREYLKRIPMEELDGKEREKVFARMVSCGMPDIAYRNLRAYGCFKDAGALVSLLKQRVEREGYSKDVFLLAAAYYAFRRGKRDTVSVAYLVRYFQGTCDEMCDVWLTAGQMGINRHEMTERILLQSLFSGAEPSGFSEIFRIYLEEGADAQVKEAVISGFAQDYFAKGKSIEAYVIQEICSLFALGQEISWVQKLAVLKYFAENREDLTPEEIPAVRSFLKDVIESGVHLQCLHAYAEEEMVQNILDKTVLEYRCECRGRVRIFYRFVQEDIASAEYESRYMEEVCEGVWFAEFILFFADTLEYYITEEEYGDERRTAEGILQKDAGAQLPAGSKYELINEMLLSRHLQDDAVLKEKMTQYYCKEFLNDRLFELR